MRRVRGQRPEDRQRLRKNTPFSEIAGRSAFGPEAEVREVHTFDAMPILRTTASAYKRPVKQGEHGRIDWQRTANSGH